MLGHPSDPPVRNSGYKSSATAGAQQCSTEFVLNTEKSERRTSSGSSRDYRNINTSRGTPDILNNSAIVQFFQFSPNYTIPSRDQSGVFPAPGQMPTSAAAINPRQINRIARSTRSTNQNAYLWQAEFRPGLRSGPLVEVCSSSCLGHKTSGEVWGLLQARMEVRNGTREWRGERADHLHRAGHLRARSSASSTCKRYPDKQTDNQTKSLVSNRSYIKTLGF